MRKLTHPTIHDNGTPARHLADAYSNAADAVNKAVQVMAKSAPNGRDYYTQDEGAYEQAVREHDERRQKLCEVFAELQALMDHCLHPNWEGPRQYRR